MGDWPLPNPQTPARVVVPPERGRIFPTGSAFRPYSGLQHRYWHISIVSACFLQRTPPEQALACPPPPDWAASGNYESSFLKPPQPQHRVAPCVLAPAPPVA